MIDIEKTSLGIREMIMRDTWRDIDFDRPRYQRVLNDVIVLLKEYEPKTTFKNGIQTTRCGVCGSILSQTIHSVPD